MKVNWYELRSKTGRTLYSCQSLVEDYYYWLTVYQNKDGTSWRWKLEDAWCDSASTIYSRKLAASPQEAKDRAMESLDRLRQSPLK